MHWRMYWISFVNIYTYYLVSIANNYILNSINYCAEISINENQYFKMAVTGRFGPAFRPQFYPLSHCPAPALCRAHRIGIGNHQYLSEANFSACQIFLGHGGSCGIFGIQLLYATAISFRAGGCFGFFCSFPYRYFDSFQ